MGVSFGGLRNFIPFQGVRRMEQGASAQATPSASIAGEQAGERGARQRVSDGSMRSRLLRYVTLDKPRRNVAMMGRQWVHRTRLGGQPTPPPADPMLGFGAQARQLLAAHPELCRQLRDLQAQGWTIGDQQVLRESDLRGHRQIALHPDLALHQPAMFVSILARHCGAALHQAPLSLASERAFSLGFLEKEAAGALNAIALEQARDVSGQSLPLTVDRPMREAYQMLRSTNGGVMPSAAQMAMQVHEQFALSGQLGMRVGGQRRERLADDMQRQYQAFGLHPEVASDDIARVEHCFNRTGVAHAASSLAAFGTDQSGDSYWLQRKQLSGMIHRGVGGFARLGIAESQIAAFIEQALAAGRPYRLDDRHLVLTYHDRERDQAVQLYLTLGERPGEITSVQAGSDMQGHFVKDAKGQAHWFDLAHCDPLDQEKAIRACATHGIDAQYLLDVVHTATLAGRATELPPDAAVPGVTQTEYQFTYRHQPMSAVLRRAPGKAYVNGLQIRPRETTPVAATTGGVAADIAERMDSEHWKALVAGGARFGMPASSVLEKVVKPDNMIMPSIEYPGFFQYRTRINGETLAVLARLEDGIVVEARMLSAFEHLLHACPVQEAHARKLQSQGWQIGMGSYGQGIYCDTVQRRIVLGDATQESGVGLFKLLVHEMAHARYDGELAMGSEDAYVASSAANEGNSLLSEYEALEDLAPGAGREEYLDFLSRFSFSAQAMEIYQRLQHALAQAGSEPQRRDARLAAQLAMGDIYARQSPASAPDHVTYESNWRAFYREYHGDDTKAVRIGRLAREQAGLTVTGVDGSQEAPSLGNIYRIKALPPRPQGEMGRRPSQLFVTSSTLHQQSIGQDFRVFANVVDRALMHCEPELEAIGTAAEQAIYRFEMDGVPHQVAMVLDGTGQVFSIKHAIGTQRQGAGSASPMAASTS
ncbi:hypothetical protein PMI40_00813 [Herbaspirillum sp. YR522]|nr:hypothetical protein PMI40_00813 [Herbaspirillum sp. YR522]